MWNLLAIFENLNPLDKETILKSLNILWQGLLAIFVVIALIIIIVKLTSLCIVKATAAKEKKQAEKAQTNTPSNE